MKTILLLLSLSIFKLFAYEDLGIHGETYPIKEKNFKILLYEKYNQLNLTDIEKKVKVNATSSFKIKTNIETCKKTQVRTYYPTVKLDQDLKLPFANTIQKEKGTYNILKEQKVFFPYNIIFIDADDEVQVELARLYKQQLNAKIRVFVAKGNYLKLRENKTFRYSKISREGLESKAFNLKCLPSIYTQKDNSLIINEYNPNDLMKEDK